MKQSLLFAFIGIFAFICPKIIETKPFWQTDTWKGQMKNIADKKKSVLDGELERLKALQQKTQELPNQVKEKTENIQELERIKSVSEPIKELPPVLNVKPPKLSDFEEAFEKENLKTVQTTKKAELEVQKQEQLNELILDEKLHFHIVYLTPAKCPDFSPTLLGKPEENASRAIFKNIPDKWINGDTPYNPDKGNDHSSCVRISSGFYAGYYNNTKDGIHLKGHPEAKSLWGKNWGGAWGTADPVSEGKLLRRILFVVDVSNSMNEFDPPNDSRTCFRRLALKQVIVKNSVDVNYGVLYFHEKKKYLQKFYQYKDNAKNIYSALDDHACRGEGGTNMTEAYNEAIKLFQNQQAFDTIIMITDQDGQSTPIEDFRMKSGGIKILTNRENLFITLDHLVRL